MLAASAIKPGVNRGQVHQEAALGAATCWLSTRAAALGSARPGASASAFLPPAHPCLPSPGLTVPRAAGISLTSRR